MKRGYSRAFTPPDRTRERTYLLDHIPAAFWATVKAKSRRDGVSVRATILHLLTLWVRGDVAIPTNPEAR